MAYGASSLILGLVLLASVPLYAYENICTHPVMAGKSAKMLASGGRTFLELDRSAVLSKLGEGAEDEDSPNSAVFNHFYNPLNGGSALDVRGLANVVFDLSQCRPSESLRCDAEDAVTRALRYRASAVKQYRAGNKLDAYATLGRSMHLLQDMHQPAHVHNDAHVPKQGVVLSSVFKLDGHDASPIESSVELACNANPARNIPDGAQVPFASDPAALIIQSAYDTALRSKFRGGASTPDRAILVENSLSVESDLAHNKGASM